MIRPRPANQPPAAPTAPRAALVPSLTVLGNTDASVGEVRLRGTQLPPGEFGEYLASKTEDFVPAPGGSQGNLCLGGVTPGDSWVFQGWYRDVNPMPTSNFTDAVRVTFD